MVSPFGIVKHRNGVVKLGTGFTTAPSHTTNLGGSFRKHRTHETNNNSCSNRSVCDGKSTKSTLLVVVMAMLASLVGIIFVIGIMIGVSYGEEYSPRQQVSMFNMVLSSFHWTPKKKRMVMNSLDEKYDDLGLNILPFNPIYRIPEAMAVVGDRSDRYAQLRQLYDTEILPLDYERSQHSLQQLQQRYRSAQNAESLTSNKDDAQRRRLWSKGDDSHSGFGDDGPTLGGSSSNIDNRHDGRLIDHRFAALPTIEIPSNDPEQKDPMYNIYDCPSIPPIGYPFQWNMLDVLKNWPTDNITLPSFIYQGLCVFDYQDEEQYNKAITYRNAELPFVVVNDPEVARTVERWNSPGYLEKMLGTVLHRTEYSENNHFMYYVPPKTSKRRLFGTTNNRKQKLRHRGGAASIEAPQGWKEPTTPLRMTYAEWLRHANATQEGQEQETSLSPDAPHWYFRLIGCGLMGNEGNCDKGSSEYLYDELPFFQPRSSSSSLSSLSSLSSQFYVVEPSEQKGIHCRFGMKGVIAENHFDGSRNMIALLGGRRRYLLAHPNQCSKLALYPKGHPSARHSAVDWSNPDIQRYPEFATATVNEVVLLPGQVLYLPTDWFHYIVSLEINYQCNTRSGITNHYKDDLRQCGF